MDCQAAEVSRDGKYSTSLPFRRRTASAAAQALLRLSMLKVCHEKHSTSLPGRRRTASAGAQGANADHSGAVNPGRQRVAVIFTCIASSSFCSAQPTGRVSRVTATAYGAVQAGQCTCWPCARASSGVSQCYQDHAETSLSGAMLSQPTEP